MANKREFPWLTKYNIAHRGLFQTGSSIEENTRSAATAAIEAGCAVEVDVQVSADNIIMVHHDKELGRLTEGEGLLSTWGFQQLREKKIGASDETMPTLPDILDVVDGQVPLFVEVKAPPHNDIQKTCAGVRHCFEGYGGPVAIMSFDPRIMAWFKTYMPKYARGMVLGREVLLSWKNRLLLPLMIRKTKPDFIACDINLLPNSFCAKWRKKGKPLLTWTVKTDQMEEIGKKHADALIFEKPAVLKS